MATHKKVSSSAQTAEDVLWVCHSSGGLSPAPHRGDARSIPGHSMSDLLWTQRQLERLHSMRNFGGQSGSWGGSSSSTSTSRVSIIPPVFQIHLHIDTTLIRRTSG